MRIFTIISILLLSLFAGDYKKCWFTSLSTDGMMRPFKNCIKIIDDDDYTNSDAQLSEHIIKELVLKKGSLEYIHSSDYGEFYVNESGFIRRAKFFDNGADYFEEGLARTKVKGKIGFFDKDLKIVIPPIFDFAFPFKNGISIVCMGCKSQKDGEHWSVIGGKWGTINKKGEIVSALKEKI